MAKHSKRIKKIVITATYTKTENKKQIHEGHKSQNNCMHALHRHIMLYLDLMFVFFKLAQKWFPSTVVGQLIPDLFSMCII